jgi:hypothetical protein
MRPRIDQGANLKRTCDCSSSLAAAAAASYLFRAALALPFADATTLWTSFVRRAASARMLAAARRALLPFTSPFAGGGEDAETIWR